jgi:predicted RNase H-like HicB family nuclease
MKSEQLVLRCYAENKKEYWQVFCLDLTLAAQGDTFEEAKEKLESMICSYVSEALTEDKDYADQLLSRPAPLNYWAKYYFYAVMCKTGAFNNGMKQLFKETLPLIPACHG